jgi:hypothetical protein
MSTKNNNSGGNKSFGQKFRFDNVKDLNIDLASDEEQKRNKKNTKAAGMG